MPRHGLNKRKREQFFKIFFVYLTFIPRNAILYLESNYYDVIIFPQGIQTILAKLFYEMQRKKDNSY